MPLSMSSYAILLRHLPLAGGLTRLGVNAWTNRAFARGGRDVIATMRNGTRILVDIGDHDGRILYLFGTNDPKVSAVTIALLRRGDCFLDIGANYGSIGFDAARRVGSTGCVHLFEPQPRLGSAIKQAIGRRGLENIKLHPIALLDRDEKMILSYPPRHSGMATLMNETRQRDWQSVTVPVKDAASYLPPLVQGRRFGAKLDVEGAEPKLLPTLFMQSGLRFIVLEVATNQEHLYTMVRDSGLALYGLCRRIIRKMLRRIDTLDELCWYHDAVAVALNPKAKWPRQLTPDAMGALLNSARPNEPDRN